MAISLDVSDIKPLLGTFGLGQAPDSKLPDLKNIPVPPMPLPPKPTPAQAGFSAYAADPLNQQKVMNSITPPGQPIIPATAAAPVVPDVPGGNVPASLTPNPTPLLPYSSPASSTAAVTQPNLTPAPPPSASPSPSPSNDPLVPPTAVTPPATPAPIPTFAQWEADNPNSVEKPVLAGRSKGMNILNGITAGLIGAAGGIKGNPLAGVNYVDQMRQNDQGVDARNQAKYQGAVIQPLQDAAKLADTQSQTDERRANADKRDAAADYAAPFTMTKEQATAVGHPELAGTQTTKKDFNAAMISQGKNDTTLRNTGLKTDSAEKIAADRNQRMKDIAASSDKTKTLLQQMRDVTSRSNTDKRITARETGPGGGFKVPADVTKRAALASNVNENANGVDALLKARPDMLGAVGGRYTNVQQMIGSDDPDIHEMGVRMHNIALASNGAHGVRAQGAIQKTEDELFNNFKSGPHGVAGALKATRDSMQTFLNDEANFQTTGQRTGGNNMTPPAQNTPANSIPAAAAAQLQEGVSHTFGNGQVWTKKNGAPTRLK